MGEKEKREVEERCMSLAIKSLSQLNNYRIDTSRSDVSIKEESPDFILKSQNGDIIGVEHFLVDTLFDEQQKKNETKYHSYSRQRTNEITRIYNKYKNGNYIANKQQALDDIANSINRQLYYKTNFNSCAFEIEFLRILGNHAKNIETYKKAQDGYGNPISRLGFVCEIRVDTTDYIWKVYNKGKWYEQKINGIPMLNMMWAYIFILLGMKFIDFFIFTIIPISNESNTKTIYLDINSNPKTYNKFEYLMTGHKVEIHLTPSKI